MAEHHYKVTVTWTGNTGTGTSGYRAYSRNHEIAIDNKITIPGSSDPAFRGDKTRHNPEDLLLSSISTCHMLWYLHLCSDAGIIVIDYTDHATGTMTENPDGSGRFTEVTLNPTVTITNADMVEKAQQLHHKANKMCYVANSLNFEVGHRGNVTVKA